MNGGVFSWKHLGTGFKIDGRAITLVGPKGIRTPTVFSMSISISTTRSIENNQGI
jgi:hypothetical protein